MFQFFKRIFEKTIQLNVFSSKQNASHFSLKNLEEQGVRIQKIENQNLLNPKHLIYTSQLPIHILPWLGALKEGVYQMTFSSEVRSQIQSGILAQTGGVARNKFGPIVAHGKAVNPLFFPIGIVFYQIGVYIFGAYYLQKIGKSMEKINKKISEIYSFQLDKRTAQIMAYHKEFSYLCKGILEFANKGNTMEVYKRIESLKQIRLLNLPHLLHLQKNLQDKEHELSNFKRESWFGSKSEYHKLLSFIEAYQRNITDYQNALVLDIICTKTEIAFSLSKSVEEVKSRLVFQKEQISFSKGKGQSHKQVLDQKISELLKTSNCNFTVKDISSTSSIFPLLKKAFQFKSEETLKKRMNTIESQWEKVEEFIEDTQKLCTAHIQSVESMIKSKDDVLYLKVK